MTSKIQLILLKYHCYTKNILHISLGSIACFLVSKTIRWSNVMTQMVICPKMKYKYVSLGSLPQFHSTTKCYLEIKAWNWGIKMRNQSTSLTNIIASWQKSRHCFDPKPHRYDTSSIWAAGQVSSQQCKPVFSTKSNSQMLQCFHQELNVSYLLRCTLFHLLK